MALRELLGRKKPRRPHEEQRIQRLAEEIIDVAQSMEADVRQMPRTAELEYLFKLSRECRARAQQATSRWSVRRDVERTAAQIHHDHWCVVTLRSELDAIMSGRNRERGSSTRSCKFATGNKPVRSRWSTVSSPTRPTGLD